MLLYVPATAAANGVQTTSAPGEGGSKGNIEEEPGGRKAPAGASVEAQVDGLEAQPCSKPLRARDTDCHVLGVVSQGQHESITVRVLTPSLGQTTQRRANGEKVGEVDFSAFYNPATGRPEGFLLPRDRRRMTRLATALNAQLTTWTVHRLMSLTTLHREFQVRTQAQHGKVY